MFVIKHYNNTVSEFPEGYPIIKMDLTYQRLYTGNEQGMM